MKIAALKIFLLLLSALFLSETVYLQEKEEPCGRLDQPPCHVLFDRPCEKKERFPDCRCDEGLKEKSKLFRTSICIYPEDGRHSYPRLKREACGGKNQRPCKASERSPACYDGLTIKGKKCVPPPECGGLDQPPCEELGEKKPELDMRRTNQTAFLNPRCFQTSLEKILMSSSWSAYTNTPMSLCPGYNEIRLFQQWR